MRRLAVLAVLLVAAGCDSGGLQEQQAFDIQALSGVSDGVTADDWQIAPFFRINAQVTIKPEPNPATPGEFVSLQIFTRETVGELALYRRDAEGNIREIPGLFPERGPNAYTFSFPAGAAAQAGSTGTRLIVLDGLNRVVTYGDLVLR